MKRSRISLEQFWEIIEFVAGLEPVNAEVLQVYYS